MKIDPDMLRNQLLLQSTSKDLCDFLVGGYFITRKVPRPKVMSATLLPEEIVTVSSCIADMAFDYWAIEWATATPELRQSEAGKFGISPELLPEVLRWATAKLDSENEIGWPGHFLTLVAAREYAQKFLHSQPDLILLGIGLHKSDVLSFIAEIEPQERKGQYGVSLSLRKNVSLPTAEEIMGFEILGYELDGSFHSWLCNRLEAEIAEIFTIRPGKYGLLQSYSDAKVAADHSGKEEAGAAPAIWRPWLLVSYSLR